MRPHAGHSRRLADAGFTQVVPGMWAKICVDPDRDRVIGRALWHDPEAQSAMSMTTAVPLRQARVFVAQACRALAEGPPDRRDKAMKLLSATLASDLMVSGEDEDLSELWSDVDVVIGYLSGRPDDDDRGDDDLEIGRRRRRRRRRGRRPRRARMRRSMNRLTRRVAHNKTLGKLRSGYAKVIKGPVGDTAAGLVASVLSAWGVPPAATRTAIKAHHARIADRMEKGGWAGVLSRATDQGGSFKTAMKEEGRRFARGWKDAGQKELENLTQAFGAKAQSALTPKGKPAAGNPAAAAAAPVVRNLGQQLSSLIGEDEAAAMISNLRASGYPAPAEGQYDPEFDPELH